MLKQLVKGNCNLALGAHPAPLTHPNMDLPVAKMMKKLPKHQGVARHETNLSALECLDIGKPMNYTITALI